MTFLGRAISRPAAKLAYLAIAAIIISFPAAPGRTGAIPSMGTPGDGLYISVNAMSVIKTQKAADSIKNGIRGIDVSKHNGTINWKKVANDNVEFVFVRSTYGTTIDPNFVKNATGAHQNGLKVGAYHFATFKTTAQMKKEAAAFVKQLKKVDITYPVVLDLEEEGSRYKSVKKATLTKLATGFMDILKDEGYDVMLYSGYNFINSKLDKKKLSGYNLWVANYLERPQSIEHMIWQHTGSGKVSGISGNVDINIAYEDLSAGKSGKTSIKVSQTVSNSIKKALNERYDAGLPIDGLNMASIKKAIAAGLQSEINAQWGLDYPVNGSLTSEYTDILSEVRFTNGTSGNITYLVQTALFYKGHYKGEPTASYDADTAAAVKAFQTKRGMAADGELDAHTLYELFLK